MSSIRERPQLVTLLFRFFLQEELVLLEGLGCSCSILIMSKSLNNLKNLLLFMDLKGRGGHRMKCCPGLDRQTVTGSHGQAES